MTPEYILAIVVTLSHTTIDDLLGVSHHQNISRTRHIAMALIKENCNLGVVEIGHIFNRDHSAVSYGLKRARFSELFDVFLKYNAYLESLDGRSNDIEPV